MPSTKQFINNMVKGGFFGQVPTAAEVKITVFEGTTPSYHTYANVSIDGYNHRATIAAWLINPAAWQAVGRVRGWFTNLLNEPALAYPLWRSKLHEFNDHLADGKSIEEALAALE